MKKSTKQNIIAIAVAFACVLLMVGIGLALIAATTETGNTENQPEPKVPFAQLESPNTGPALPVMNLDGGWTFTTDKGGIFDAKVDDKTIRIEMKALNGTSMLYWNGTFETYASVGAVIVSKTINDKAALSQSSTKNFTVGEKTLSFSFTMQGVTKVVDLSRV